MHTRIIVSDVSDAYSLKGLVVSDIVSDIVSDAVYVSEHGVNLRLDYVLLQLHL